jgi:hypothetical protein
MDPPGASGTAGRAAGHVQRQKCGTSHITGLAAFGQADVAFDADQALQPLGLAYQSTPRSSRLRASHRSARAPGLAPGGASSGRHSSRLRSATPAAAGQPVQQRPQPRPAPPAPGSGSQCSSHRPMTRPSSARWRRCPACAHHGAPHRRWPGCRRGAAACSGCSPTGTGRGRRGSPPPSPVDGLRGHPAASSSAAGSAGSSGCTRTQ